MLKTDVEKEADNNMPIQQDRHESLLTKYLKVVGAVSLYWFVSICMVFLNKYLLKSELDLNAPIFVTWYQCVMTVVLCCMCSKFAQAFPNKMSFPSTKLDYKLSREVLPLSVVFVGMITLNNLCLREVGVAFYTIARSLVTLFSLIFTYLILGKKTTYRALLCCGVIFSGFVLGVNQEAITGVSALGVIYGVSASACVALNAIYIKKSLPGMDNNIWKLTYYNNINACAMFLPLIIISELGEIFEFEHLFEPAFWLYMSIAGFFGFIMGYVVGLQVKVTTPVTHTVSGVAKACFQTVLAVLYDREIKTSLWWFSNLLVLGGTGSYSVVKSLDMKASHEQETNHSSDNAQKVSTEEKKPLIA